MRAVVFPRTGPPEVLETVDLPDPEPGPGQVRVRVRAAGVQPVDTALRRGVPIGPPLPEPRIPGNDFAGTVDRVGEGVGDFAVGDPVLGWAWTSCYAEYAVVGADRCVPKPEGMPWEEAGVLPSSAQTAHTALEDLGVGEGDTLLVHAAAGGVGTFAVQLARVLGARVIGTCGPANDGYLASLGAVPVRHGPGLADRVRALAPEGVDAALDMVGGDTLRLSVDLVGDPGRVGTLVDHAQALRLGAPGLRSRPRADRLAGIVDLYTKGELRVHVSHALPLHEAARAHRLCETRRTRGKIALLV